ncbi:class I SAM-dependent methyltransferase [Litoricolaceae bacterium]|nr:class I SAM-dependent methyltransferase [Litorivicinaceae bacterium]
MEYKFTNNWFEINAKSVWEQLFHEISPAKVLEIGSYEGRSTTWLLEQESVIEITCIDSWQGGAEHQARGVDMIEVERRWDHNRILWETAFPKKRINKIKGRSSIELAGLLRSNEVSPFDFVYVDGSHDPADVIVDACLAFDLLGKNGILVFDDYTWIYSENNQRYPHRSPKIAIDFFTTVFSDRIRMINAPIKQIIIQKIV